MLFYFCMEKELCMSNTCFNRELIIKATVSLRKNESKIGFILVKMGTGHFRKC